MELEKYLECERCKKKDFPYRAMEAGVSGDRFIVQCRTCGKLMWDSQMDSCFAAKMKKKGWKNE